MQINAGPAGERWEANVESAWLLYLHLDGLATWGSLDVGCIMGDEKYISCEASSSFRYFRKQ